MHHIERQLTQIQESIQRGGFQVARFNHRLENVERILILMAQGLDNLKSNVAALADAVVKAVEKLKNATSDSEVQAQADAVQAATEALVAATTA